MPDEQSPQFSQDQIDSVWTMPEFHAMPIGARRKVMSSLDPRFGSLPEDAQDKIFDTTAQKYAPRPLQSQTSPTGPDAAALALARTGLPPATPPGQQRPPAPQEVGLWDDLTAQRAEPPTVPVPAGSNPMARPRVTTTPDQSFQRGRGARFSLPPELRPDPSQPLIPVSQVPMFNEPGTSITQAVTGQAPLRSAEQLRKEHPQDIGAGTIHGLTGLAEGLTTPANAAMLAGMPLASPVLATLASVGISASMANDLVKQYPEARKAAAEGRWGDFADMATQMAGEGAMLGAGVKHGIDRVGQGLEAHNVEAQRLLDLERQKLGAVQQGTDVAQQVVPEPIPVDIQGRPHTIQATGGGDYAVIDQQTGKPVIIGSGPEVQQKLASVGATPAAEGPPPEPPGIVRQAEDIQRPELPPAPPPPVEDPAPILDAAATELRDRYQQIRGMQEAIHNGPRPPKGEGTNQYLNPGSDPEQARADLNTMRGLYEKEYQDLSQEYGPEVANQMRAKVEGDNTAADVVQSAAVRGQGTAQVQDAIKSATAGLISPQQLADTLLQHGSGSALIHAASHPEIAAKLHQYPTITQALGIISQSPQVAQNQEQGDPLHQDAAFQQIFDSLGVKPPKPEPAPKPQTAEATPAQGGPSPAPPQEPQPRIPVPGVPADSTPLAAGHPARRTPIAATVPPEEKHKFSFTQVQLPEPMAATLRDMGARIPDEHLAEDGRENDAHVTVKFGLHGEDPEEVRRVVESSPPIRLKLGKTSLFKNDEADVVKVDVDSPDLHALNKKISEALPNTDTHPTYTPHATVAYVKPGEGKRYEGLTDLHGHEAVIDHIVFSGKDGSKTVIPLLGKEIASEPTTAPAPEPGPAVNAASNPGPAAPAEPGASAERPSSQAAPVESPVAAQPAEAAPIAPREISVKTAQRDGTFQEVPGVQVTPHFALHRTILTNPKPDDEPTWSVTHLGTGLTVLSGIKNQHVATEAADRFEREVPANWEGTNVASVLNTPGAREAGQNIQTEMRAKDAASPVSAPAPQAKTGVPARRRGIAKGAGTPIVEGESPNGSTGQAAERPTGNATGESNPSPLGEVPSQDVQGTGDQGSANPVGERSSDADSGRPARTHSGEEAPVQPGVGSGDVYLGSGLGALQSLFDREWNWNKQNPESDRFEFPDKDVEARFQAAGKPSPDDTKQKIREAIDAVKHLGRQYPNLDPKQYHRLIFELNRYHKQAGIASTKAVAAVVDIVSKLDKNEEDLLRKKIVLDDMVATLEDWQERGQADGSDEAFEMAFGLTPEKLRDYHDAVTEEVYKDGREKVAEAVRTRHATWGQIRADLIEAMDSAGVDVEPRMRRRNYYRHRVLEQMQADYAGGGLKVRTPRGRSYMKQRGVNALDFSTHYIETEYKVLTQIISDTAKARFVGWLKNPDNQLNITDDLKEQARQKNIETVMPHFEAIAERINQQNENPDAEPVTGSQIFRRQLNRDQARAIGQILEMAGAGELPEGENGQWRDFTQQLGEAARERIASQAELDEDGIEVNATADINMPALIAYANWLIKAKKEHGDSEAAAAAGKLFKGIQRKRASIKEIAGDKFVEWEDMLPEGFSAWQPDPGNIFYSTYTVPEQITQQLLENDVESYNLTKEDLRKAMVMGGQRAAIALPTEVVKTLDDIGNRQREGTIGRASAQMLGKWKQWQLISPGRVVKYNLRNMTGDADITMAGNPKAFLKMKQAAKELYAHYYRGEKMTPEMEQWFERGGFQSNLQAQEMGDLKNLDQLKRFFEESEPSKLNPVNAAKAWFRHARMATDFREGILRYANFLEYLDQMNGSKEGKPANFGASIPDEIMGLDDNYDRAYKLSNDLVGAYDEVSQAGQYIRRHWLPFWSYQEVNFRRYWRLVKNAARSEKIAGGAGGSGGKARVGAYTAYKIGKFLLQAGALYGALNVINHLLFPEEEKSLPKDVRQRPHIVLGRGPDGRVIAFTRVGNIPDLEEWFDPEEEAGIVRDWLNGRTTAAEAAQHMAIRGPVEKVYQSLTPVIKMPGELVLRKTAYPRLDQPRNIYSRAEYIADSLAMGDVYRRLAGKPSDTAARSIATNVIYEFDPKQSAYYDILDAKNEFLKAEGKQPDFGFRDNPKTEALRNLKLAVRKEDKEAFTKYLIAYAQAGGNRDSLKKSIEAMNPMNGLNKGTRTGVSEREAFYNSLSDEDKQRLVLAMQYYQEVFKGPRFGEYMNEAIPQVQQAVRAGHPAKRRAVSQ